MGVWQKIWTLLAVMFLCGKGVNTVKFHRCRAGNPRGKLFTISGCPAGQVINIQYAEVGYSQKYNPSSNPPECPWRNCTKPTTAATPCNGRRSCDIDQDILLFSPGSALRASQRDGNFIRIEFTCVAVTTTTTMTNDENAGMVNDTKYNTAPCAQCGNMMTTFKVNSSQRHNDANQSSLSAGAIAGIVIVSVIFLLLATVLLISCCVCPHRRKANRSSSNGRITETTTKKTKKLQPATYELDSEVTGVVDSLGQNGNSTRQNDSELLATYANDVAMLGRYNTVSPVQVSQEDYRSQVDKKRTARTAQHGAEKYVPGDWSKTGDKVPRESGGVMEEDRTVCDSVNDVTLVDNPIYANASVPASAPSTSPSSAAAAISPSTAESEAIFTSINDFTLIDNAIYND